MPAILRSPTGPASAAHDHVRDRAAHPGNGSTALACAQLRGVA